MPKAIQQVTVDVKDKGTISGKRILDLTVSASAELFTLSDLLVKESAIRSLDSALKSSARRAISEYISSGRTFVKEVTNQKKRSAEKSEEKSRAR